MHWAPWRFTIIWSPRHHTEKNSRVIQIQRVRSNQCSSEGGRPLQQRFCFTVMRGVGTEKVAEDIGDHQIQSLWGQRKLLRSYSKTERERKNSRAKMCTLGQGQKRCILGGKGNMWKCALLIWRTEWGLDWPKRKQQEEELVKDTARGEWESHPEKSHGNPLFRFYPKGNF